MNGGQVAHEIARKAASPMKWTDGITCYPETLEEITTVFESRKNRDSHPDGMTDKGGRWYPSKMESASCCKDIRSPSRAHPYSYMVHCRTRKHIQTWYAEHVIKVGEGIGLGVGFGAWVGPQFHEHPTLAQLKVARAECVMFALAMHRRILRAHPQEIVIEWEGARRYWIQQAYHIHGEICMMIARATPITAYYGGRGEMHTDFDY